MDIGRKRILVVDDSSTMRLLLKMVILRNIACDITEARDGLEALKKINTVKYDLIITDINMPHINGLDLVFRVRKEMGLSIPIIIVTTEGAEKDQNAGMELGADTYITKPINSSSLLQAVSTLTA